MKICVVFADGSSIEYSAEKINSKWFSRKVSRWCKRNNTRVISKTKSKIDMEVKHYENYN